MRGQGGEAVHERWCGRSSCICICRGTRWFLRFVEHSQLVQTRDKFLEEGQKENSRASPCARTKIRCTRHAVRTLLPSPGVG